MPSWADAKMHVHLPKPLHGWREFAGEVGIIVVGVLIALAAEQVVEDWSWHHKVTVVREALMGELGNDRARWNLVLEQSRCALQQSGPLDAWARDGGRGEAPPFAVRASMLLSMHTANWTLAAGSQTLDHFPMREQLAFAALYAGLANRQKTINEASTAIDRAHTLLPLGSDPQGRLELRETLGDLRNAIDGLINNESYMKSHFDALGVKADDRDFASDFLSTGCGGERKGGS